jgi:integrase
MALEIHKARVRAVLTKRREPYWGPRVADDLTVGFRKLQHSGTWIARLRNSELSPEYLFHSLGLATPEHDYEWARTAALKWREARHAGVQDDGFTVTQACQEYVEDRRRVKGELCAHWNGLCFKRCIYGTAFGNSQIAKLKTPSIKRWLEGLELQPAHERRTWAAVKAALNLAARNRNVHATVALEWRDITPREGHDKRRDLYLDLTQRRALLAHATGAFRDLLQGAMLTGARVGELVRARRSQFEGRTQVMTFIGKTGSRTVPLSPAALALFSRMAESKLPTAYLFMRDDGQLWTSRPWNDCIKDAATLALLPPEVCMYTLRHSFITETLLGGMPTLEVARLVGTSVMMIEKHYGHLVVSAARERLAKVQML